VGLSVMLMLPLASCGGPLVAFSPFTSVEAQPPPVTAMAIEIRPGDRQYLKNANPKVLGWVAAKGDVGDEEIGEQARIEAARRGGTHILLRADQKELDVRDVPLAWGRQRIEESENATYVVLRVSPDSWKDLPDPLRPKPLPPPEKP